MTIRPNVPQIYTECEAYRGFIIATYNGYYRGFGLNGHTMSWDSRSLVRREIDETIDEQVPA